jgi:hypothetical protein
MHRCPRARSGLGTRKPDEPEIRRANLDGSSLQTILTGLNPQGGLAFVTTTAVVPEPSSVLFLALGLAGLGIVELRAHRREGSERKTSSKG